MKALKDEIRQKSDKDLKSLLSAPSITHYQHVKDKNYDHGVGYFEFSKEEELRKEQQKFLNSLRQETKKKRGEF